MIFGYGIFVVFHPGQFFVGPESEFLKLTKAEKREKKQRKKVEKQRKKDAKVARKKGISLLNESDGNAFKMGAVTESQRF